MRRADRRVATRHDPGGRNGAQGPGALAAQGLLRADGESGRGAALHEPGRRPDPPPVRSSADRPKQADGRRLRSESLAERTERVDPKENAEARGLLGRVYKQLYINAALSDPGAILLPLNRLNLQRAIDFYLRVYRAAPAEHLWHGVNAAALAARAERDKVPLRDAVDYRSIGREILATIEARKDPDAWEMATAAEACLVFGEHGKALQWIARYVMEEEADAFELASPCVS